MAVEKHKELMREAIALSLNNVRQNSGGPFAALIVRNETIVSVGTNLVTSMNDPTAHAEIMAIREACRTTGSFKLDGCAIYTTCEPCPMCLGAIYWARLDRIYYANSREEAANIGFDDRLIYSEISFPIERRQIPAERLLEEEALIAFREWERKENKTRY
ncbi:MAG TPA: nucleoside deaminase [Bacteroidota bacterium]